MTARTLLWHSCLVVLTVSPIWAQDETADEDTNLTLRELPSQVSSLAIKYQGFEVGDKSVQPTGGIRTGELPDYDSVVEQFWGAEFDFDAGDTDGDGELTEVELLDLLLEQSLENEEAIAWATVLLQNGDVNKDNRISQTELMVLHYAPLLERQLRDGYLSDGSTHVQITFDDESLTEFANTFAYFVATLRVEGYPAVDTDILALERKIGIDPLYFDHKLLPNLKNKAAFNLTNQTIRSDGKIIAMGINLCLFELNCIVRVGRFDRDDDLALTEQEWEVAKDVIFPEDEHLLSLGRDDETFSLENNDRTPTFEILDTNSNQSVTVAEIMQFLRDSLADFGDLKL